MCHARSRSIDGVKEQDRRSWTVVGSQRPWGTAPKSGWLVSNWRGEGRETVKLARGVVRTQRIMGKEDPVAVYWAHTLYFTVPSGRGSRCFSLG